MASYNIKIGKKLHITATLLDSGGIKTLGAVTWTTSNAGVATVVSGDLGQQHHPITGDDEGPYTRTSKAWVLHGTITAIGAGTCTVTAHCGSVTAAATINVSDGTTVASIVLGTR